MNPFDHVLVLFWASLNAQQVDYLMIGGVATNMNGFLRATMDVDVWIDDTPENRRRVRTAFREYGLGDIYMMETLQIVPGWTNFHLNNGVRLDLMVVVKGLEGVGFAECRRLASTAEIME